jgi:chromosome segregation ATPase
VSRKFIVMVPVSLTLLMTSCSDSKVVQCQRLIKQVDDGIQLIEKDKGSQVITSGKLAKELEDVTQKVRELNIKDPKLKDYQNNFVKVFENLSQNIGKASKALASAKTAQASVEGRNKIQKAKEEIEASLQKASDIAKQSDSAASELKKYCIQVK